MIGDYVAKLLGELPGSSLRIMQSGGGLTDANRFRGHNAVLSGPAAGLVAYAHIGCESGFERTIGFDMGGRRTFRPSRRIRAQLRDRREFAFAKINQIVPLKLLQNAGVDAIPCGDGGPVAEQ